MKLLRCRFCWLSQIAREGLFPPSEAVFYCVGLLYIANCSWFCVHHLESLLTNVTLKAIFVEFVREEKNNLK